MDDQLSNVWQSHVRPGDVKALYCVLLARHPEFDTNVYEQSDEDLKSFFNKTIGSAEFDQILSGIFQTSRLPHDERLSDDDFFKVCDWLVERFGIDIEASSADWRAIISSVAKNLSQDGSAVSPIHRMSAFLQPRAPSARLSSDATENKNSLSEGLGDQNLEFDAEWYVQEYPDLKLKIEDAYTHYMDRGSREGRHAYFDPHWYVSQYRDVISSGLDPFDHYVRYGRSEFRSPSFDKYWYLDEYEDVLEAKIDPFEHYMLVGKLEGRHPAFNRRWYLSEYTDVAGAKVDPYHHYRNNGKGEGRYPNFNAYWYAREYPDVSHTDLSSYGHFLKYGRNAGYKPAPSQWDIAAHKLRLTNFPVAYDSEYQPQMDFSNKETDIKALCFYLPQFHECEDNNKWWGQGFTEWTNTKRSTPRFEGHYQPREPHEDIGYYDLSDKSTLLKQAKLAKQHGIYGFCFYHYWFSGRRILEKPVDILLENKDIDIPFCLCWANENWTKTWDGMENDILLKQEYSNRDPFSFISDIAVYLNDERYIRIDNKPVIIVYKPHLIPDVRAVFAAWKHFWKEANGTELLIWCNRTEPSDYQLNYIDAPYDAVVEFPPHLVASSKHVSRYALKQEFAGIQESGHFYDYQRVVDDITSGKDYTAPPRKPFYRGVMLGWDNSARRAEGQSTWYGFSIDSYYKWLRHTIDYTRKTFDKNNRFVFINAWNEWAEGTYLEPDRKTGYTSLNTTSRALFDMDLYERPLVLSRSFGGIEAKNNPPKIAIHLHVYYVDQVAEFAEYFLTIGHKFDLIITADSQAKVDQIELIVAEAIPDINTKIILTENLGRDIGPLMLQVAKLLDPYEIFAHFHTKKSTTVTWGEDWRRYLTNNLIGMFGSADSIIDLMCKNPKVGVVSAPPYPAIAPHVNWGGTKERCRSLLDRIGCDMLLPNKCTFPVGNMFWARSAAVKQLIQYDFDRSDFEMENMQVGGTLPHCIERIWAYVAAFNGYTYKEVLSKSTDPDLYEVKLNKRRLCLYVHYSGDNSVSEADLFQVNKLRKMCESIVVVSNSPISENDINSLHTYVDKVIVRANIGYDFAAWRDAIREIGWTKLRSYDEVIFANNSCYGPAYPLEEMFSKMEEKVCDFWGVTAFPTLVNSNRPEAELLVDRTIHSHVQSYFMVIRSQVLNSPEFFYFWEMVEDKQGFTEVVTSYEIGFTKKMIEGGFRWAVYLPVSEPMQLERSQDPRFNLPYNKPYDLLLMRNPLVKKRAWDYAPDEMVKSMKLVGDLDTIPPHALKR